MADTPYIVEAINRIDQALNRIEGKVDNINLHGCAQRLNDERRIEAVEIRMNKAEGWVNKGIVGTISGLGALVILFLKFIFQTR